MSEKTIPNGVRFLMGGLAGMGATCFVHPLDVLKNRMQITTRNECRSSLHCMQSMIAHEGPFSLYKGFGAGLLRQATYTTIRLGVYSYLQESYQKKYQTKPRILMLTLMGMTSGAIGAFFGTPAELILIRMSADGRLPPAERRNYKNVVDALTRIVKEEGPLNLFSGCVPTVARAMVVNIAQLVTYTKSKDLIVARFHLREGVPLHFVASMVSGLITTIVSMPMDIAKTRIQNMKTINGIPEFSGPIDVFRKIAKNEGFYALWKGFTPYYARIGPHTVLTFIFLEQMQKLYSKFMLGD